MKLPTFFNARLWAVGLALCLAHGFFADAPLAAEPQIKLQSLRGVDVPASDPENDGTRIGRDRPPLPRDFVQQPPLIPHTTKGYTVTMNFNKCLDCHAWSRAKESGATKISVTHFQTREGQELTSISPRRYFCEQCHVPQSDAQPLVGNTFKPGVGLR